MHAYVERVSKLDKENSALLSKKHSTAHLGADNLNDTPSAHGMANGSDVNHLNASMDKMNRSQQIECISELDSENEFSCMMGVGCVPGGFDDDEVKPLEKVLASQRGEINIKRLSTHVSRKLDGEGVLK